jgi:NAD(P)-dependent dehydrogenase (short-subunit alcohol dehydrogenase family)
LIAVDLTGRVAFVTGAGAGIGRAIAGRLAEAGAHVAVNDIDPRRAGAVVDELRDAGLHADAAVADVRDRTAVAAAIDAIVADHGHLDVAVNNVGMTGGVVAAPFLETSIDDAARVIERNLLATYICCQAEAAAMAGRGGVILNVTSGEAGRPSPLIAAYGAAKAAISHLTVTLAVELGPLGIRVNAMAPGTVYTEQVQAVVSPEAFAAIGAGYPLGRSCTPDDLGRLAVFLASDLADSITGQVVAADNGAALGRAPTGARPTTTPTAPGGSA